MDRALKERVIGAIVLVGVAVLVVPVFLDGSPGESQIVSKAVALPGQSQQQGAMQTVVLNRDRELPVPTSTPPASNTARAPEKSKSPLPKPEAPAKQPAASPIADKQSDQQAEAVAQSVTGMWAVQLGSFSNEENAERLAADLRKQGFAAFLSRVDTGSGALHRVRIGPQKDRDSAETVAAKLDQAGHS
ncbi:MAG: SPOR domain-containing protein, partial [Woeseiaceae bacterium]|nr:SPOR domain-containing protein [Woeseiaceae bacterium]